MSFQRLWQIYMLFRQIVRNQVSVRCLVSCFFLDMAFSFMMMGIGQVRRYILIDLPWSVFSSFCDGNDFIFVLFYFNGFLGFCILFLLFSFFENYYQGCNIILINYGVAKPAITLHNQHISLFKMLFCIVFACCFMLITTTVNGQVGPGIGPGSMPDPDSYPVRKSNSNPNPNLNPNPRQGMENIQRGTEPTTPSEEEKGREPPPSAASRSQGPSRIFLRDLITSIPFSGRSPSSGRYGAGGDFPQKLLAVIQEVDVSQQDPITTSVCYRAFDGVLDMQWEYNWVCTRFFVHVGELAAFSSMLCNWNLFF